MGEPDTPVTLVIKAPTQHVDDQTLVCGMSWTIERLKRHISDVYPSKPKPGDQRLIYYGQVLRDKETLQEVLTRFEQEGTTHTLHLVCIPSREAMSKVPMNTNNRNNSDNGSGGNQNSDRVESVPSGLQHQSLPQDDPYGFRINQAYQPSWVANTNADYFQQLAWAQQAYAHYYMSQYMEMLARQNGGQPVYGVPEREAPRPAEPVPARAEDDDRNRDWLDYLYVVLRMIILISFVTYYSSFARFLIVSFLGLIIYLYQGGFFRLPQPIQPVENNNEMLNNNVAAENNNLPRGEEGAAGAQAEVDGQAVPLADENATPANASSPPSTVPVVERPSILTLTWTFFSSFFASLIPENPNVV